MAMGQRESSAQVVIIGGGAAGLAAAAAAAGLGADTVILEQNDRVGKKLLRTGNGRCNLTNMNLSPDGYNHPEFTAPLLEKIGPERLLAWFSDLGLWTAPDEEGRVYPCSGAAASVLDVLRLACEKRGVTTRTGFAVSSVSRGKRGFRIEGPEGEIVHAGCVIVAAGGGTRLAESLGHSVTPFVPVLCPLRTDTSAIRGLSGVRVRCRGTLLDRAGLAVASEEGELLFRDYGVSGVMAFDLSRYLPQGKTLSLDLAPERSFAELRDELSVRAADGYAPAEYFTGAFRRGVAEALLRYAGSVKPAALARAIKDFRLEVRGAAETGQAQVTRGGVKVKEFDPLTLRSSRVPGLYVVGEALDIDGRCGGYNLHWAFVSGLAAGTHAAGGELL